MYLRNGIGVGHLTRVYGGMEYNTDWLMLALKSLVNYVYSTEEMGENSQVTWNSFGQGLNLVVHSCYSANYVKPFMMYFTINIYMYYSG